MEGLQYGNPRRVYICGHFNCRKKTEKHDNF